MQRLGNTLQLALTALIFTALLGVTLGVLAAVTQNRLPDHLISSVATLGMSVPGFWLGIVSIIVFSVRLGWLPSSGVSSVGAGFSLLDRAQHLVMPAGVLAFTLLPNVVRVARSAMLEVLSSDYVRTARAKGMPERRVILRHILRNALIPVVTVIGLQLGLLLSGAVLTETIFSLPGLGRLMVDSILSRDYPVVQAAALFVALVFVAVNLAVDLTYGLLDPRVRPRA